MQEFEGRVAVITGGASGIGAAMARTFGAAGMRVVIGDIEQDAIDTTLAALRAAGIECVGVRGDVTDPAAVDALADAAEAAFGAVDLVCLNAGVGGGGLSWECPVETWEWVLAVNMWGVIHGIRTFVPRLMTRPDTHVVITASIAGIVAGPFMGPYNASKHAAVALAETLHHELMLTGSPTKVSVVCPSWVDTAIAESARNRQERFRVPGAAEEAEQAASGALRALLEQGISPDDVARSVIDAVRDDRFWVFTHADDDSFMQGAQARIESTLRRENPTLFIPS